MIKSIKLTSNSVALLVGATIFINVSSVAHASDPTTRKPYKVIRVDNNSRSNLEYPNVNEPKLWGHDTRYNLKIVDNSGNPYELGSAQEWFSNRSFNPIWRDPKGNFYFKGQPHGKGAFDNIGSTFTKGAYFTDQNYTALDVDFGRTAWWYSFDQSWHVVNTPNGNFDLKNTHHIEHIQKEAQRTGDG